MNNSSDLCAVADRTAVGLAQEVQQVQGPCTKRTAKNHIGTKGLAIYTHVQGHESMSTGERRVMRHSKLAANMLT